MAQTALKANVTGSDTVIYTAGTTEKFYFYNAEDKIVVMSQYRSGALVSTVQMELKGTNGSLSLQAGDTINIISPEGSGAVYLVIVS